MFKKFAFVMAMVLILSALSGCAKVVSTETYEAPVRILSVDYRPAYSTPMKVGKVMSVMTHPADYDVVVEYNGVEYELDSRDSYKAAENNVGSAMQAVIEKVRYEDGDVRFKVLDLVTE